MMRYALSLGGFMWNRKRWMRYSRRLQTNSPSRKTPGNADSGMATEYSAWGATEGGQGLEAPAAQPRHLGAAALGSAAVGPNPPLGPESQSREETVRMRVGLFRRSPLGGRLMRRLTSIAGIEPPLHSRNKSHSVVVHNALICSRIQSSGILSTTVACGSMSDTGLEFPFLWYFCLILVS